MAKKSKWFRVAFEGQTASDGRKVSAQELNDCVSTFNADTYAAPINVDHTRPIIPGGPLDMKGRILALSAKPNDVIKIGTGKDAIDRKGVGLYAEVEPYDGLIALNAIKQKRYPSVEITPNFGGTGKAGLIGLALTDSPAVLGVDMMEFSTQAPAVLNARKQHDDNFFTATVESVELEFEEDATPNAPEASAFTAIANFFNGLTGKPKAETVETPAQPTVSDPKGSEVADPGLAAFGAQMAAFTTTVADSLKSLADGQKASDKAFADFKAKLEAEPDPKHLNRRRPLATGESGNAKADY